MSFSFLSIIYIFICYFTAAFLKGITGLGFSTICLPLMILLVDIKLAIPMTILPSIASNITVMRKAGYFKTSWQRFWPLYLATLPGLFIGLIILKTIDSQLAGAALGIILAIYAGWALRNLSFTLSPSWQTKLILPTGFCTGLINGVTGSQLMPVLPYMLALGLNKNQLVQAINISFTISSLVMLLGLQQLGYLNLANSALAALGILAVVLGINLGNRLREQLSEDTFKTAILLFLFALGLLLLSKPFYSTA